MFSYFIKLSLEITNYANNIPKVFINKVSNIGKLIRMNRFQGKKSLKT